MEKYNSSEIPKSSRITRLVDHLYAKMPEIESYRAKLITESYKETEDQPIITRRAKAFSHILHNIPIIIRDEELIVGSNSIAPRGCQTFPEFSYQWLEDELDTVATRTADPFYISEQAKADLREVHKYWKGKTTSELATAYMAPEAIRAIDHNIFTPGNYFYNGVGHVTVKYWEVLEIGYEGIMAKAQAELDKCNVGDGDYAERSRFLEAVGYEGIMAKAQAELDKCNVGDGDYAERSRFLEAVIMSCQAVIDYADRYAKLALEMAEKCTDPQRKAELLVIASNCSKVPAKGATNFWEACQSFWFVQQLLQMESSGHSISPGRFDQYMYPYYKKDIESGAITRTAAQELLDCIWVKLNDLNKVRDAASAEGFAGYSLFQNLIVGGQDKDGNDVTNDLSFMCIEASMHVHLPAPSLSIRVWNGSPHDLLIKAAELTRTGIGLPAYYNDEVIIPALQNRGLSLADAREYNIIGCVEPQKAGKTEGWHDAAFFNMCRPLELVFGNGMDQGEMVGIPTGDVTQMETFDEFYDAYKKQMEYCISLLVNADNAIDVAHAKRCPLPFLSSMILYAIRQLVYQEKKFTMEELKEALAWNYGKGLDEQSVKEITTGILREMTESGAKVDADTAAAVLKSVMNAQMAPEKMARYQEIHDMIAEVPKFGNDIPEVDYFARDVAYTYTRPLQNFKNPRGGQYQAGLYPVSANVPLGGQTGATPDGRYAHTPVADGVSPSAGKDVNGPTAAASSVAKLDHFIVSNGTLFNQKFHPSALSGREGLEKFVALIRSYFDQKGMHMQFNVVSRETLLDAQAHPENYKHLVVRVAGYSALFTTLSKSLQDDIIRRTEQGF